MKEFQWGLVCCLRSRNAYASHQAQDQCTGTIHFDLQIGFEDWFLNRFCSTLMLAKYHETPMNEALKIVRLAHFQRPTSSIQQKGAVGCVE